MVSLRSISALFAAIVVLHFAAIMQHWYWSIRWFDIPMHYLGGVFAGMLFYWIFSEALTALTNAKVPFWVLFAFTLGWAALIGVIWEFSEYASDMLLLGRVEVIERAQQGMQDTMEDLFLDLLGGASVALFLRFRYNDRKGTVKAPPEA